MSLSCPRCDVALTECSAMMEDGAHVLVETCDTCAGLWVDGPKLAAVCPTLSDLPARRLEVVGLGHHGAGIASCPRCAATPFEFTILEVNIDICTRCGGVWFDGDEYEGMVLQEGETRRTRVRSDPRGGPYRKAIEAVRTREILCGDCSAKVPLDRAFMWEVGFICKDCHYRRESQQRAQEMLEQGSLPIRTRDPRSFEAQVRASPGLASYLGEGFGSLLKTVYDLARVSLESSMHCRICGGTRCKHRA